MLKTYISLCIGGHLYTTVSLMLIWNIQPKASSKKVTDNSSDTEGEFRGERNTKYDGNTLKNNDHSFYMDSMSTSRVRSSLKTHIEDIILSNITH